MRMILLTVLLLITQITAARAQSLVALELVLLADATGSIDDAEIRFQRIRTCSTRSVSRGRLQ